VPATIDESARRRVHEQVSALVARVVREARVDLVHVHGLDFAAYLPPPLAPVVATLHLPLAWYAPDPLPLRARGVHLVCVSRDQRSRGGEAWADVPVIDNGVDTAASPAVSRRRFALALGRVCPEKGLHDAVAAARAAGVPLLIAGAVHPYPTHTDYFRTRLLPALDGQRRFIGPIAGARKRRLLAAARCLIVPSLADETSSLVAMEALAAGTPVVARRVGALPALVEHGRTGFLVDDVGDMAEALRRAGEIAPDACRAAALARFDAGRMAARYLALYDQLAPATSGKC
jgi:glycosyltransferase involved in cell wall biosynthesis